MILISIGGWEKNLWHANHKEVKLTRQNKTKNNN